MIRHKFAIITPILLFGFLFSINFVFAGSATLSWNPNAEADLNGYRIYYGTSPRTGNNPKTCVLCGYLTKVDVGKTTTYTISNLTNGQTYYFSVSAYDTSNNESVFSSEVNKLISLSADLNVPPDGHVNSVDFGILLSYWGATNKPRADLNVPQDGIVNSVDFGILMSQWTG
ncbi:MAG: hypothetical protein A2174_00425 [Candidatus Portnoybacteria bacterium RBG_13_41_18]|uniref:Fibronectin type-III domain-containing protein n=1 Tax=Candidatus Portnoybacteria bacterium RBG_13_41_18 TaxID=1801991 RepID=A0A1G2FB71_9BACT|nr:MAG: hypothetical protein A2174_00425 [Candidatus Portnoybacteria bacterium RBG_13_41_18]